MSVHAIPVCRNCNRTDDLDRGLCPGCMEVEMNAVDQRLYSDYCRCQKCGRWDEEMTTDPMGNLYCDRCHEDIENSVKLSIERQLNKEWS